MINFYLLSGVELCMSHLRASIEQLLATDIVVGHDYGDVKGIIKRDAFWAYLYARDIIGGRWIEAEPYIMKDSYWALEYARDVIRGRWPEAEPVISTNEWHWKLYCGEFGL